jgi:death-on-curing protein
MTEYLGIEDTLLMVRRLGVGPVREIGLLDAALGRPRSTVFGKEAYPTLALKAAALLHSLAKSHPLVDGNKRLAWLATTVFLELNGHGTALDDEAAFRLVRDVAAGDHLVEDIALGLQVARRR